jgi:thioredoxin 2
MATTVRCPNCGKLNRVRPTREGVPRCAVCHEPLPWIVDASEQSFDAEIDAAVPVLIDFWAPWCGPCRMVSPLVERIARDRPGRLKLVKLNVDEAPQIAGRYGVQGIPLLVLVRERGELDRLVGAVPEAQLQQWLEQSLAAGQAAAG